MYNQNIVLNPGVIGAKVSLGSAFITFCAHGLPVVQYCAAVLGSLAALMSVTWIGIQMYDRFTRGRKP